jgi:acyl-CoA thioester hydrolase
MTIFDIEVAKRFKDIDPYDHVSHAIFPDYVLEARIRMYRLLGFSEREVIGQVVVNQEINFFRPVLYGLSPLMVQTWFSHLGNSSFTVQSRIVDEGQVAADAKSVMVCFDVASSSSRPIPDEFRRVIEEHLES